MTTTDESRALDEIKIGGLGASRKRVEDDRFIRGKGNYVDDIVLPGMLHMEILRSPLPHARIKSIDASRARVSATVRSSRRQLSGRVASGKARSRLRGRR